jgi:hypothetical protein
VARAPSPAKVVGNAKLEAAVKIALRNKAHRSKTAELRSAWTGEGARPYGILLSLHGIRLINCVAWGRRSQVRLRCHQQERTYLLERAQVLQTVERLGLMVIRRGRVVRDAP